MAALEWAIGVGLPATPDLQAESGFPCRIPFAQMLRDKLLRPNYLRSAIGNGYNFISMGKWVMWLLSNTRLRKDVTQLGRTIGLDASDEDSDSDCEIVSVTVASRANKTRNARASSAWTGFAARPPAALD